jgi:uncharacterized protein (TIGR01244 family)
MSRTHLVALMLAATSFAACATTTPEPEPAPTAAVFVPKLEPYTCEGMERVYSFDSVFLASQPDDAALEKASKNGIRLVINLREPKENGESERALVEKLGMTYANVPVSVELLDDSIVDRVRALLHDSANHPVMIHCSSGNRVGMVWAAIRATRDGVPLETAIAEGKTVGMKTPAFETFVRDYAARRGVK